MTGPSENVLGFYKQIIEVLPICDNCVSFCFFDHLTLLIHPSQVSVMIPGPWSLSLPPITRFCDNAFPLVPRSRPLFRVFLSHPTTLWKRFPAECPLFVSHFPLLPLPLPFLPFSPFPSISLLFCHQKGESRNSSISTNRGLALAGVSIETPSRPIGPLFPRPHFCFSLFRNTNLYSNFL